VIVQLVYQTCPFTDHVVPVIAEEPLRGAHIIALNTGQLHAFGAQQPRHRQGVGQIALSWLWGVSPSRCVSDVTT
jgi:hypothetical protein